MPPELTPTHYYLLYGFAFAMGCCIGSFLNVVIYRVPRGMRVDQPRRSFCPHCKYAIPWWQNLPILSWLLLRGKCRSCREAISPRYLLVELLTGGLFLATAHHCLGGGVQNALLMVPLWVFMALLIAGTFIDLEHYILPDSITLGGIAVGLVSSYLVPEFFLWPQRQFVISLLPASFQEWLSYSDGMANLITSAFGAIFGLLGLWSIVVLGKALFGRQVHRFAEPVEWSLQQADDAAEPIFRLGDDNNPWSEMFSSKRDRLVLHCPDALVNGTAYDASELTIRETGVVISRKHQDSVEIPLADLQKLSGTCTQVTIPRDVMGLGDVKFLGCIGAFLGWQGVLFTVLVASLLGATISLTFVFLRKRELAQKVPFGPYLALGALIFLFFGPRLISDWNQRMGLAESYGEGNMEEVVLPMESGL
jgi:leader peptidase (prepilin peptidase) / N-methyltransferase